MVNEDDLKYEKEIVWLEYPEKFPWVRENKTDFCQRQGIPQSRLESLQNLDWIVVGYTTLEETAPPAFEECGEQYFYRRLFFIKKGDYESYKGGNSYPVEAKYTKSLQPKFKGINPRRKCQIAARIPVSLMIELESHIQKTGISQTDTVIGALAKYLGCTDDIPLVQRVFDLEKRVTALEARG